MCMVPISIACFGVFGFWVHIPSGSFARTSFVSRERERERESGEKSYCEFWNVGVCNVEKNKYVVLGLSFRPMWEHCRRPCQG
jgi:hypothetical protein